MHRVFVYGTLKRHCRNNHLLENARFECATTTSEACWDMVDAHSTQSPGNTYPAVMEGGKHRIDGEIYAVDDNTLAELDELENVGERYKRVESDFADGSRAYIYINIDSDIPTIKGSANISKTDDGALSWFQNESFSAKTQNNLVLLDGGMGQELYRRGIRAEDSEHEHLWSANALETHPEIVKDIHIEFIRAGARVITTNTYCTNPDRLLRAGCPERFDRLNDLACELAQAARRESGHQDVLIAGCLPPLYGSYRPDLNKPHDIMLAEYRRMTHKLAPRVDIMLCETMSSGAEALAAASAAADTDLPIWVAFTLLDDGTPKLRSHESVIEALSVLKDIPLDGVLFNCCSPESILPAIREAKQACDAKIGAYANGFKPIPHKWRVDISKLGVRQDLGPHDYLDFARTWIDAGADIVGGCCEIGPEHIRAMSEYMMDYKKSA